VQDVAGGPPRLVTPEGLRGDFRWGPVSPDGRLVAGTGFFDGRVTLYPIEAGTPREIPGDAPGQLPVRWSADGRALFTVKGLELPIRIFRLDLASGRREGAQDIVPADPAGLGGAPLVQITADGRAWVCTYARSLTDLYLAEGLR